MILMAMMSMFERGEDVATPMIDDDMATSEATTITDRQDGIPC
jgi:hypothetical protein